MRWFIILGNTKKEKVMPNDNSKPQLSSLGEPKDNRKIMHATLGRIKIKPVPELWFTKDAYTLDGVAYFCDELKKDNRVISTRVVDILFHSYIVHVEYQEGVIESKELNNDR